MSATVDFGRKSFVARGEGQMPDHNGRLETGLAGQMYPTQIIRVSACRSRRPVLAVVAVECRQPRKPTPLERRDRQHLPQETRSSAIAEGPRDASRQLKSFQLPRNSAETTSTTIPEQIEVMKLEGYSGTMCNKHVHSTTIPKTRVPGLSCGVVCVILRLAVLVELRLVTDR